MSQVWVIASHCCPTAFVFIVLVWFGFDFSIQFRFPSIISVICSSLDITNMHKWWVGRLCGLQLEYIFMFMVLIKLENLDDYEEPSEYDGSRESYGSAVADVNTYPRIGMSINPNNISGNWEIRGLFMSGKWQGILIVPYYYTYVRLCMLA